MGKFVISTRSNGEFQFNLKASNGQVILVSEGYSTRSACDNGIESVRKNALDDSRYERKTTSAGKFRFNLKAGNGQIVGSSETYESESGRDNGIESVKKAILSGAIVNVAADMRIDENNYEEIDQNNTKPLRIKRLQISRIGPFDKFDISFLERTDLSKAEIHILTGQNGTGKSTLLQLLSRCIPQDDPLLSKKQWDTAVSQSNFSIEYSDNYVSNYDFRHLRYNFKKGTTNTYKHLFNDSMFNNLHPQLKFYLNTPDDGTYTIAFFAYSGYRKLSDSNVESIINLISSPFENALDFDKSTNTKTFVNWLASVITKRALATVKRSSKDKQRASEYDKLIVYVQQAISDITGQNIEFDLQEDPLKIIIYVDDVALEFDQLPDGLKSIISWIGDLIMRLYRINWSSHVPLTERNFILFLDEIEIHLHPAWQRKILPVIQRLFINAQIFVSTHSPFVVGSVDGAWVYRLVKKNNVESVLAGPPVISEDSYSYEYILSEIFDIKERFGIEVENKLKEFNEIKNKILRGESYNKSDFADLVQSLQNQSIEVQNIVGMELRQLKRLTNNIFV